MRTILKLSFDVSWVVQPLMNKRSIPKKAVKYFIIPRLLVPIHAVGHIVNLSQAVEN
jgi:hypothetical protein